MAQAFASHYISRAPQAKVWSEVSLAEFRERFAENFDDDAANYVARAASQAFSPLKSGQIKDKAMPRFHHQTLLSKVKKNLKKNPDYFNE